MKDNPNILKELKIKKDTEEKTRKAIGQETLRMTKFWQPIFNVDQVKENLYKQQDLEVSKETIRSVMIKDLGYSYRMLKKIPI